MKNQIERVLIVPASKLFDELGFINGFSFIKNSKELDKVKHIISKYKRFVPRPHGADSEIEHDKTLKQIIPYGIFYTKIGEEEAKLFVYRRKGPGPGQGNSLGDKRLANIFSIGVGGHVNENDGINDKSLMLEGNIGKALWREISEEVSFTKCTKPRFIGFINLDYEPLGYDDFIRDENYKVIGTKTKVSSVHFGLVYLIQVSDDISVSEQEQAKNEGFLIPVSEVGNYLPNMEPWSYAIWPEIASRFAPLFGHLHKKP